MWLLDKTHLMFSTQSISERYCFTCFTKKSVCLNIQAEWLWGWKESSWQTEKRRSGFLIPWVVASQLSLAHQPSLSLCPRAQCSVASRTSILVGGNGIPLNYSLFLFSCVSRSWWNAFLLFWLYIFSSFICSIFWISLILGKPFY